MPRTEPSQTVHSFQISAQEGLMITDTKPPTSTVLQFGAGSSETPCRHGDWCVVVVPMATARLIVTVNHDFLLLFRPSLPPSRSSLFQSTLSLLDDEQGHLVSLCVRFLLFLLFCYAAAIFDL